ncbi:MAG TPA: hypothetical protein DCY79_04610 [Planctomycetaceae bacterium]|nr:hypothetical protein [Blastopirellula sp.]HAY79069.1 hypothetical protein [Planctomycetaceae bacterium]|tara:strand:+ start:149 stop:1054 length:906 start_codon:yes stop_codon:yes gene_type:complete
MQLDRTRIVVRERGILDLLDLSLQVTRAFLVPLLLIFAICVTPMLILNYLLIGWMADIPYGEELTSDDLAKITRYVTDMLALIIVEAPLVTALMSAYLGKVVFLQQPTIKELANECGSMLPQLLVCQGLLRGTAVAWILVAFIPREGAFGTSDFLLLLIASSIMLLRSFRPYLIEIILLERNPLFGKRNTPSMTIRRRMQMLHGPSSGDICLRSFACGIATFMLFFSVWGTFIFIFGVLFNQWVPGAWMMKLGFPLAFWTVLGFMTVVRFLTYLDLRIRQEGWEVELRLRAEASRLAGKLA